MNTITIKEIGRDFLNLCASGNPEKAFSLYTHKNFIHHNPFFKGDADSLMIAMEESSKINPNRVFEIKHMIMDGDLVAYHSYIQQTQSDAGLVVVHILKFVDNKIIEMWDMHQQIPEVMINENGMI